MVNPAMFDGSIDICISSLGGVFIIEIVPSRWLKSGAAMDVLSLFSNVLVDMVSRSSGLSILVPPLLAANTWLILLFSSARASQKALCVMKLSLLESGIDIKQIEFQLTIETQTVNN